MNGTGRQAGESQAETEIRYSPDTLDASDEQFLYGQDQMCSDFVLRKVSEFWVHETTD